MDGDHFAVVWDPRLIPPETRQYPAFDYDASARASKEKAKLQGKEKENEREEEDEEDEEEKEKDKEKEKEREESKYMIDCMSASIGKVAVLHRCVCDILPLGAREPLAIQLAEQASVAVDQPKTGLGPVIPEEGACEM